MKSLTNVKKIIVHAGNVHMDDLLCLCLALVHTMRDATDDDGAPHAPDGGGLVLNGMSWIPPVFRCDPTADDLADPNVLVMDVGGQHDPELLNFDHHQLDRDAPPCCALTLLVHHLGLEESFRLQDWFGAVELIDAKGPFAYSKAFKMSRFPGELVSPIETALKAMLGGFSGTNEVLISVCEILLRLGIEIAERVQNFEKKFQDTFLATRLISAGGVLGILFEGNDNEVMSKVRAKYQANEGGNIIGFSVSHDDRAQGWTLYRFEDDPRIDFSKVEKDPRILFAHGGGFIAKTHQRLSVNEVKGLIEKSIE